MTGKRTERLGMRLKPKDKKDWKYAADKAGLSLSAWIESRLNNAALDEDD